jgi:hypothetical protein
MVIWLLCRALISLDRVSILVPPLQLLLLFGLHASGRVSLSSLYADCRLSARYKADFQHLNIRTGGASQIGKKGYNKSRPKQDIKILRYIILK